MPHRDRLVKRFFSGVAHTTKGAKRTPSKLDKGWQALPLIALCHQLRGLDWNLKGEGGTD